MEQEGKKLKVIGLIMEDIFTEFAKEVIRGVENAAKEMKDIRLIVLVGRQNEQTEDEDKHFRYKTVYNYIYRLEETSKFDGLILTLPNLLAIEKDSYGLDKIRNFERIPKVFIATKQANDTSVNYDNVSGIREALDYVIKARGMRKVCMLGGRDDNMDAQDRKRIFKEYLEENGIPFRDEIYEKTDMSINCEQEAANLLDRNPDVEAIFCINDPAAIGLYQEMGRRGLVPGKDILVFGFDNTHSSSTLVPPLASIGPSEESLGKTALELLLDKMEGKKVTSAILKTRLFGRASCPYEWHGYEPHDLVTAGEEFVRGIFDDCFYRYKNEFAGDDPEYLKKVFCSVVLGMLRTLEAGSMDQAEFERLGKVIDEFFESGVMEYSDPVKLLETMDKLQRSMNLVQRSPAANIWINRLFVKMKDCVILTQAGQKSRRNIWINSGRENMMDFLIETMDFERNGKDAIENVVAHYDKIGLTNSALYLYEVPVNYVSNGVTIFPDRLNLVCVAEEGKLRVIPKERQSYSVRDIFLTRELSEKCMAYVAFPVFYGCRIYGILLCELTPETPDRGEYTVSLLSRTLYANDIEIINSPVDQERLKETKRARREQEIYNQIAEGLASHYDIIYYVNSASGRYMEFSANNLYGNLVVQVEGKDFFSEAVRNVGQIVHPEDRERIKLLIDKDHIITALENRRQMRADYRLIIDGKPQYARMTVMWGSDQVHFIIGVEDINEEIRREEEHVRALRMANDLARRDALTGAKNITAFREVEESFQHDLENQEGKFEFAIVLCDINDLKYVNDHFGHKAGDEYIRASCKMIFNIFAHSPVFRVGGDEFVVMMTGADYQNRDALLEQIRSQVLENLKKGDGPVVAAGISVYDPKTDRKVSDVFGRADQEMYQNKDQLKKLRNRNEEGK